MDNIIIVLILIVGAVFSLSLSSILAWYYTNQFAAPVTTTPSGTGAPVAPVTTTPSGTGAPATGAPVAPVTTTSTPAPVKFTVGADKDTGSNDSGEGNANFLDRHNLTCDSNGIKRFQLANDGKNWKYNYICTTGGNLGTSISKSTGFNDAGNGNSAFLDRHNVECGTNQVLSQFKLTSGENQFKYDYTCLSSNSPLQCRSVTTQSNDVGKGNAAFLDRHNVTCNDDEALSQFKLSRPSENTIQYQYKCCKY